MWIINITIPYNEKSYLGNIAKRNNISFCGYPHSYTMYSDHIRVLTSGYALGNPKDIKKAIIELKKEKRFIHMESHGNFFILDIKQHIANKALFQPGLLYPKPGITTNKGDYIFEIASWNRKTLIDVFKMYAPLKGKLNWIQKKEIKAIQTITTSPNLTRKQKDALALAIKRGYYNYPRKIDIVQLAKEFKCAHSTFQFHLRNAEKKVMPTLL
ncbi:MAG: helix-turn-helix domain-containing protein [Candidatus Nanoarchaeia archaeon]